MSVEESGPKVAETTEIGMDQLVLWEGNPNAMTDSQFSELTADIKEEGFDEPITVIPQDRELWRKLGNEAYRDQGGRFVVVSGNHRTRATRIIGFDALPAVVKDWSLEDAAIYVVRRNAVRGELDSKKFTDLVNTHLKGQDKDLVAKKMGLDASEFALLYRAQEALKSEARKIDEAAAAMMEDATREVEMVDSLSAMLAEIMNKFGTTVEHDFLAFMWKKRVHLLVKMNERTRKLVGQMSTACQEAEENINAYLEAALPHGHLPSGSTQTQADQTADVA